MNNLFLRLNGVSKTYFKNRKAVKLALKHVSIDLYKGEIFSLLGVNGAGKTTLSSILATLHPPTAGDIFWEGKSLYQNLLSFRKIIGYCPQNPNLEKNLSLEENLLFAAKFYGLNVNYAVKRKEYLLEKFSLGDYAKLTVDQLSGGYRQRFLIARALMHDPKFVILDEPTVGLDPHIRRSLWDVISDLRSNKITVLLTTHYLDEAEILADRVCLIHDGSIRTVDTPANLKKHHKKNNLEEVFLKFVDDPNALIFKSFEDTHE